MDKFDYSEIPPHMMAKLEGYTERHEPVGDFLTALLSNNLLDTFSRADDVNVKIIHTYLMWLYWNAPGLSWGSPERYQKWIAGDFPEA